MARASEGFGRIRREHVEQACRELIANGPARGGGAYFINFDGKELPAKLILREAYKLANQHEIASSKFSGGLYTARILEGLNFQVIVHSRSNVDTTD